MQHNEYINETTTMHSWIVPAGTTIIHGCPSHILLLSHIPLHLYNTILLLWTQNSQNDLLIFSHFTLVTSIIGKSPPFPNNNC